jgi:2',3'-cyclic-nucleotide 2'-phosphodiesterase/3'-nucleotidase
MRIKLYILKKHLYLLLVVLLLPACVSKKITTQNNPTEPQQEIIRLQIVGMSDLHGNYLPYDHIRKRPAIGGLPYVYSYMKEQRADTTQTVILLNGGDYLQGQMAVYYYIYMDQREEFMPAVFLNKVGVDVSVMGNHDLEPGGPIFQRWATGAKEVNSEVIVANVVHEGTMMRYAKPYVILDRAGLRIAVLGLLTPIQTQCVSTTLVEGLDVLDMLEPAQRWMNYILEVEEPDLVIGLIHAGLTTDRAIADTGDLCFNANSPMYIARNVPGFDGIILGHQHKLLKDSIHVEGGRPVWLVEGGYGGADLGILEFEILKPADDEKAKIISATARIQNVSQRQLSQDILDEFAEEEKLIAEAANEFVAVLKDTIYNAEAFFGSSFFVDLIHKAKLEHTKAEVSFSAPLSSNVVIPSGDLTFSDMLRVYRFENRLIVFKMTGKEIKNYLEYSYGLWINQMQTPEDRLLKTIPRPNSTTGARFFEVPQYNFDSGAGLDYEVDVTKPEGERITILRMWSDRPFHEDSIYSVVTNVYRFFGAGGHLELGAKISLDELSTRILLQNDPNQIRELIRQDFIRQEKVGMFQYNNWKFVPEHFVIPAKEREIKEL